MDCAACRAGVGCFLTPNYDYTKEVEASRISYLITVVIKDCSLMDLKLKLIVALSW